MADEYADPSGNTEAFRAFVHSTDPAPGRSTANIRLLIAAGAVLAALLVGLLVWLVIS